jgi:ATP-dependent DNA ligase
MGLEGIVSKRLTAPYRSGPSRDWIKVKTRTARQW